MDRESLWSALVAEMELNLSPGNFATWIAPLKCQELKRQGKKLYLELVCPSVFHKNQVSERYLGQLQALAEKRLKDRCEIGLVVGQKAAENHLTETDLFSVDADKLAKEAYKAAASRAGLSPQLTFNNFAVSSSNEVAHAAARTAAKKPGEVYHLIFVYGGVGVGKTHLMQAVGHEILRKSPDASLVYCTGEEFTNGIIEAIRNKTTPNFRQKYRRAKVLLIDDVQFIAGKDRVQEEFFHTFNTVQKEGGQIMLTADRQPTEIIGLEDRLRSRFEGGLTVDIQPPEFELRTAILLIKAQQKGIELPMRIAQVIAANVDSTRRLEGVLMRLYSEQQTRKEPLTEDLVMALLGKINGEGAVTAKRIEPKQIIRLVAEHYRISPVEIKGERRLKTTALARQVTMYLLRKELQLPLTAVGEILGGRDHTTVMYGEDKITRLLAESERLRLDVNKIRRSLYNQ